MSRSYTYVMWLALAACMSHFPTPALQAQEASIQIEIREFAYSSNILVVAAAENEAAINSPVSWTPILFLVPDGEYVEKGEVVTEFDTEQLLYDLHMLELERDKLETNLATEWTGLRNKDFDLRDKLEGLQDTLAYLEARQARMQAMPLEDEVRIAEGRLRVARLNLEAAQKDVEKAKDRLQRGMISQAEYANFDKTLQEKKALEVNAVEQLEYARLPASFSTLRKLELEISNARMEIDQLTHQVGENVQISEIQQKGIEAKKEVINQRIREKKEELEKSKVLAPISGYVTHLREFKADLASSGGKMWKNAMYMKIPDLSTLVFKGALPESDRKHFEAGDEAVLFIAGRTETAVRGNIQSFSTLSRDWSEKAEKQFEWGGAKSEGGTGIKVYDIVIRLQEQQPWIRPGMNARCTLTAIRREKMPSVPMMYVKERNGEHYLAFNKKYRKVKGSIIEGYYVLDDPSLAGQRVDLFGEFPDVQEAQDESRYGNRFHISGELRPVRTSDVFVQDVFDWPKISWLIPEDTRTVEGAVVARLDTKEVDDTLHKLESEYATFLSEKDALIKQRDLKIREGEFNLKKERNLLEISEIELRLLEAGRDQSALYDAELNVKQAEIRLADVTRRLEWAESKKTTAMSPAELDRLKREKIRQTLKQEEARIKLAKLERGATEIELSQARLKTIEQKARVEILEKGMAAENEQITQQLLQAESRVMSHRKFIDRVTIMKTNSTIISPATGLVRYMKIFNNMTITKPGVGAEVGQGFKIMEIADVSKMFIRVEVPEAHFCDIREGMAVEVDVPSITARKLQGTVTGIEFLFVNKRKEEENVGLYSSHEKLGETAFFVRVELPEEKDLQLKPGAMAEVIFPFNKS